MAFSSTFSYLVNFTHIPWDFWQRPTNRMLTVSINLSYVIKLQSKQCSLVYWPAVHLWLTTNCKESANRQLIVFQQISTGSFGVFSCFLSFLEIHKVAIFFIVETSFKAWIFTLLSTIFFCNCILHRMIRPPWTLSQVQQISELTSLVFPLKAALTWKVCEL